MHANTSLATGMTARYVNFFAFVFAASDKITVNAMPNICDGAAHVRVVLGVAMCALSRPSNPAQPQSLGRTLRRWLVR
jgi:hypothetical protein